MDSVQLEKCMGIDTKYSQCSNGSSNDNDGQGNSIVEKQQKKSASKELGAEDKMAASNGFHQNSKAVQQLRTQRLATEKGSGAKTIAEMETGVNGRGNGGIATAVVAIEAAGRISYNKVSFMVAPSLLLAHWI